MKRHVLRTTHSSRKQKSTCKICNYCSELTYKKSLENMQASHSRVFLYVCLFCMGLHSVAFIHCFLSEKINLGFYLFFNAVVCFKIYFWISHCSFNLGMVKFFLYFQSSITTTKGQPGDYSVSSHPPTVLKGRKRYPFSFKVCFLWLEKHSPLPVSECIFSFSWDDFFF